MNVGLLGCGAIGSAVVEQIVDGAVPNAKVTGIHTRTPERARETLDRVNQADDRDEITIVSTPLKVAKGADVVVEAANQAAVGEHAIPILETGTDLLVLSIGALRDPDQLARTRSAAVDSGSSIHVPSGAIAGLDGVAALRTATISEVSLAGYRPPEMLRPYVEDVDSLFDQPSGTVVFDGTANEAAEAFPAHMNIAVALALVAGVDPGGVDVRLVVDHDAPRSVYVVSASGPAGTVRTEVENVQSPTDGDATHLVIQSTIATLQRMADPLVLGT